jgi:D-tagatose-1,6-bisphosphate aldolase subunit GatZ/KbaZ
VKALLDLVRAHRAGQGGGVTSVCSAHPLVIEATLREAAARGTPALIEATSNQVNQFGGYTGMTPAGFRDFVARIAAGVGLDAGRVLLGGDHLGPNCWQAEPAARAMELAEQMIADYVQAGFRKIHLDCSMSCGGDPHPLDDARVAERAARLCAVAETAWAAQGGEAPVYIIGTEVPVPGGAAEELGTLAVTTPAAALATLAAHRAAFAGRGLAAAWNRVIGLVVQPGVEFDHHKVIDYVPERARALSGCLDGETQLVFEAHSTDYQTPALLRALVQDHFAILKVGPAVTFALRETYWALADIARELHPGAGVPLKQVVLAAMRAQPRHWKPYYTDPVRETLDLQYSLSDRVRYYWPVPEVRRACEDLVAQLAARPLPLTLLSQYLPRQYAGVREGRIDNAPHAILLDGVAQVLRQYAHACAPSAPGAASHQHQGTPCNHSE